MCSKSPVPAKLQFAGAEYGDFQFPFDGCGSHGNKVFFSGKYKHFFRKNKEELFFFALKMLMLTAPELQILENGERYDSYTGFHGISPFALVKGSRAIGYPVIDCPYKVIPIQPAILYATCDFVNYQVVVVEGIHVIVDDVA